MTTEVKKNEANRRYELTDESGTVLGLIDYVDFHGVVTLPHTEVDRALEGRGYAGQLAKFALDDIRAAGSKVNPACEYIKYYIDQHQEYADLV